MTLTVDFYFSFRSPYSYLALPQCEALARRYDLAFNMKVVRPIAVRIPGFFEEVNPLWPPYLMRDTWRIAQRLAIPYAWPRPDPIVMTSPREVAKDQPYITRICRLGVLAAERGRGFEFIRAAAHAIWSGEVTGWQEGDHLAKAAAAAGLDLAEMEAAAVNEGARLDAVVEANEAAQEKAGHWGVPLFVYDDEPFFGQDRLEDLIWRLKQKGLAER